MAGDVSSPCVKTGVSTSRLLMKQRRIPQRRQGVVAGAIAGLSQAALLFIDSGPGHALPTIARWLGTDAGPGGKVLGALLFIVVGALGGAIFAWINRDRALTLAESLRLGLIAGAVWWVVVAGVSFIRQQPLSPFDLIYFLILGLLYGLILGNLTVTLSQRGGA